MNKSRIGKILMSVTLFAFCISFYIAVSQNYKYDPIQKKDNGKIKLLIVAGHEPNKGGANEFKTIKERDLNLQLALELQKDLASSSNLEIILARDKNGWNSDLNNYVMTSSSTIMKWVAEMKNKMLSKINNGEMQLIDPNMKHNEATSSAVLYLYGTNKWIEKNNIDLVLHVHFNNNPKRKSKPNYKGYCIYIPEHQYSNSSSSRIFANYINDEISKIQKPSTMPQEKDLIIEDQELIATGNYDTLKIPSVVVEYAYIYESLMVSSTTRNAFIEKAASSTATAIKKYLEKEFKN